MGTFVRCLGKNPQAPFLKIVLNLYLNIGGSHLFRNLYFIILFLTLIGCGSTDGLNRVPVKGKLTLEGEPLPGALVRFVPLESKMGYGGSAVTNSQGIFVLVDDRGFSGGVVPGTYLIAVSKMVKPDGTGLPQKATEDDFKGARETMPSNLVSAENSPLRFTVIESTPDANIDIPTAMLGNKRK